MKTVLIWWLIYLLNNATATGSATFETRDACEAAGKALEKRLNGQKGYGLGWMCLDAGSAPGEAK